MVDEGSFSIPMWSFLKSHGMFPHSYWKSPRALVQTPCSTTQLVPQQWAAWRCWPRLLLGVCTSCHCLVAGEDGQRSVWVPEGASGRGRGWGLFLVCGQTWELVKKQVLWSKLSCAVIASADSTAIDIHSNSVNPQHTGLISPWHTGWI